jgi:hypothetical protein
LTPAIEGHTAGVDRRLAAQAEPPSETPDRPDGTRVPAPRQACDAGSLTSPYPLRGASAGRGWPRRRDSWLRRAGTPNQKPEGGSHDGRHPTRKRIDEGRQARGGPAAPAAHLEERGRGRLRPQPVPALLPGRRLRRPRGSHEGLGRAR